MITGDHVGALMGMALVPGLQKWKGQGSVKELDGQTAEDEGYSNSQAGTRSLKVSLSLVIDILAGSLVALEEGTVIENLSLYAHVDSVDPIYVLPFALVTNCSPGGGMGDKFACDIDVVNRGPYTFNDPSALSP